MSYLQARSDLIFMLSFKKAILQLWKIEGEADKAFGRTKSFFDTKQERQYAIQVKATEINENYQDIRELVSKGVGRASRIAIKLGVPIIATSYPAPAVGGPVISIGLFYAILKDTSHGGIDKQQIYDALNQTIGECEARLSIEKRRLINPLYWIKELIVAVIRIPFMLIEASGFDVSKVEDHLFSKIFKILEIVIIVYILFWLGIGKENIQQFMMKLF